MGMFWQYFSFDENRWNDIFGGGNPRAIKRVISSAVWDSVEEELPEFESSPEEYYDALVKYAPNRIKNLSESICKNGISYDYLPPEDCELLDRMIVGFFCPEGLEDLLGYTYEHREGLSSKALHELRLRTESASSGGFFGFGAKRIPGVSLAVASAVFDGRRYGQVAKPSVNDPYFVLSASEVALAAQEIEGLLMADRPWTSTEFRDSIRTELLGALESAVAKGRALAGRFS
jgi:hypothetical protein